MAKHSLTDDLHYVAESQAWLVFAVATCANGAGLAGFVLCTFFPPFWVFSGLAGIAGIGLGWWSLQRALPLQHAKDTGASFGILMASAVLNLTLGSLNMVFGVLGAGMMLFLALFAVLASLA